MCCLSLLPLKDSSPYRLWGFLRPLCFWNDPLSNLCLSLPHDFTRTLNVFVSGKHWCLLTGDKEQTSLHHCSRCSWDTFTASVKRVPWVYNKFIISVLFCAPVSFALIPWSFYSCCNHSFQPQKNHMHVRKYWPDAIVLPMLWLLVAKQWYIIIYN